MKPIRTGKSYTKEYKKKMVKRMLPSEEITANQLSIETGIAKSTFRTWFMQAKKKQKNNTDDIKWLPVDINEKIVVEKKSIPINIKIDGVVIEINEGFNSDLLLEVMKVVKKV